MTRFRWLVLFAIPVLAVPAPAQVPDPLDKPASYDAHFRYRIRSDRDERIRQFRAMEKFLKGLEFVPVDKIDADLEIFDPTAERMDGTIPAKNAFKILDDPRIHSVVLVPAGMALDDAKKPVQVRIAIPGGFAAKEQHLLHDQVVAHLGLLGFKEAVAYEHVGYTKIRGAIPTENLLKLLKDLRGQPAGWFAPAVPMDQIPSPFRVLSPVRMVEVLPDLPAVPPSPPPGVFSAKFTADVRAVLEDAPNLVKPLRVDLILDQVPSLSAWQDFRQKLRAISEGTAIEGWVGPVVTVRVLKASELEKFATVPEVRWIRLPRAGSEAASPMTAPVKLPTNEELLASSKVKELHAKGYTGKGTKIVVISSEFDPAAIPAALGKARLIDLTSELSPELLPNPISKPNGAGYASALLAKVAAPDAEITLVRVDPFAFHQLLTTARATTGDRSYSEALQTRAGELTARSDALSLRRISVTEEYRKAFADLSDEEGPANRRKAAREALDKLIADEKVFKDAVVRFTDLKAQLDSLVGTSVVINGIVWDAGYPQDGLSELSRLIDRAFTPKSNSSALKASKEIPAGIWVQAAGPAATRAWAGPFLDADGNGVAEFGGTVPAGRWSPELNFLALGGAVGKQGATLPAGYKLRVTVQWREPHDPDGFSTGDSVFPLHLRLLRQIDPAGKTHAIDEFAEVIRSGGAPVRLLRTTGSAAFEQSIELALPVEGVYALRLEGRSAQYPIPALQQKVEIYPRIVVEAVDAASAAQGRPVLGSYSTLAAGVGIPGDSSTAVTVGIAGADGKPVGTNLGAGPGVQLRTKPDALSTGGNEGWSGPAVPTGFLGGAAASLRSAGLRLPTLTHGGPFVLSKEVLDNLPGSRRGSER